MVVDTATVPASNRAWWAAKFAGNVARDARKVHELVDAGWRVMVVWECALRARGPRRDKAIGELAAWIRSGDTTATIPRSPSSCGEDVSYE